jgi:microcystin-dependent protein
VGTRYSSVSVSGFNSGPPSDDGATTEANKVKWSTIKNKLADPLKTALESINTKLVTHVDESARSVSVDDQTIAGDHLRTIQVNTSSVTISLADATTMAAGYVVSISNQSSGNITVALATATDTIDGVTNTTNAIATKETRRYVVNAAATGYLTAANGNAIPAGVVWDFAGSTAPGGWLECDGSAVSRSTYANLFAAISTTWGTGDGSTTFNLPDYRDKVRIGRGTGTVTASGVDADVDTSNDTLTVASNNTKWVTGMSVVFTLASGTITGLTSGNTYYVIRNNATTVKLASSLANAQAGTAVDMTAKSSPVWTITHTYTARTLGETGGEEGHAQSITELLAHTHPTVHTNQPSYAGGAVNAESINAGTGATNSRGGNVAMNVMQPFAASMAIIKT